MENIENIAGNANVNVNVNAKKSSGARWGEIRERYAQGGITQRELAAEFGVPLGTLRKKAAQENWSETRRRRSAGAGACDTTAREVRLTKQLAVTDRLLDVIGEALEREGELNFHTEFAKSSGGSEFVCQRLETIDDERLLRFVKAVADVCELQRILLGVHEYRDELAAVKLEQDGRLASRKLDIEMLKLDGGGDDERTAEEFVTALLG